MPAPSQAAQGGWQASVAALSVQAGRLDWRDATTAPAAELRLSDFTLSAQAIAWPFEAPVVFNGAGVLGDGAVQGKLTFSGRAHTASATVDATLVDLPLAPLRPYLRSVLAPSLTGELSADLTAAWTAGDGPPRITVDARRLAATHLSMGERKAPDFAAEAIELGDARIDTVARKASIGRVALRAPRVRLERDASRHWGFERWPAGGAPIDAGSAARESTAGPASRHGAAPWQLAVDDFVVEHAQVGFDDRGASVPVAVDVRDLDVQVKGWALGGKVRAPFRVTGRIAVPAGPSGKAVGSGVVGSVDARGELKDFTDGVPSGAQAALLLKDLPLHLLDPYLDDVLNIDVRKAQTSFKGDVRWERRSAGSSVGVRGDATVDDFSATNAATDRAAPQRALAMLSERGGGRQLLNWKSLSLRGIELALAPGARPRLRIAETALSDFFARIVLDENGRLNLEDVARPAAPPAAASGVAATAAGRAGARASTAPAATGDGAASLPAIVDFGPIAVVNGRVAYNDRFVKPNYNANISELSGRLGAFSSEASASAAAPLLADLTLKGRVEGTASLEITGKVNPLAKPLALDLQAKVRDLELPPLSPYAIKYSGYGIERGKMSVDLAYVVQPDGKLTASNRIVLNQLAFGDKVEGSTASLPVKLAVALLADRHGVIDLDLPVSGSINDPQFSLGGVIWKAVTNLLLKAVTAPFALLASAFGGSSSELSRVEFAAGSATLDAAATASLDKVAKALADRPALGLTVTGESRLEVERDAWKKERLQQLVRAEKRRQALAAGAAASADVTVAEAEYPALLKEVYKRADIVKPKNVIGIAKDVPPGEMEALLLGNINVTADAMQQLAVRRGVAVRDYLASREIPIERLFLGAPKTASDETGWSPRADLKLATQ